MLQCLIVTADWDDGQHLARLLRPYGFELAIVKTAEQAMSVLRRQRLDLIVLPEKLHGLESYHFIRHARRATTGHEPKVLVYAERPQPGIIARAIRSGASEYFQKPFDAPIIDLKLKQVGLPKRQPLLWSEAAK
jgi:DNA-binding response OmpR family regulator